MGKVKQKVAIKHTTLNKKTRSTTEAQKTYASSKPRTRPTHSYKLPDSMPSQSALYETAQWLKERKDYLIM